MGAASEKILGLIEAILGDPVAPEAVECYLTEANGYAAGTFNTLGVNDPWAINEDDLVAVHLLGGMSFSPHTVRRIFETDSVLISTYLKAIPLKVNLWEQAAAPLIANDGPADALWHLLAEMDNVAWVKAGKLLARKRPRLIPIYDKLVKEYFNLSGDDFWEPMRLALRENALPQRIEATLRPAAWKDKPRVTTIRLLDIAIWMKERKSGPYSEHSG